MSIKELDLKNIKIDFRNIAIGFIKRFRVI